MAADDVSAAAQVADLGGGQEGLLAQTVRGNKEMAAPSKVLQHARNRTMETGAPVVERQEDGTLP